MLGERGAEPLEVARPQRDRPSPGHAAGRVREADELLAAPAFEEL
jgi:hypothetical protein